MSKKALIWLENFSVCKPFYFHWKNYRFVAVQKFIVRFHWRISICIIFKISLAGRLRKQGFDIQAKLESLKVSEDELYNKGVVLCITSFSLTSEIKV